MKNIFKLPISSRLKPGTIMPLKLALAKQKELYVNTKFKYNIKNNHGKRRSNEKGFRKGDSRWK
jgi:hypothetical protein